MSRDDDIDDAIRSALRSPAPSKEELADLRLHILELAETDSAPARFRQRRVRIVAILAAVIVLVPTGVAVGAAMHRAFIEADPITEKIDQLRDEEAPLATEDDYRQIAAFASQHNARNPDESIDLADHSKSRVIVDTPAIGRVVGVPSTDGTRWCYRSQRPSSNDSAMAPSVLGYYPMESLACSEAADVTGVSHTFTYVADDNGRGARDFAVVGLASDDVTRIEVELADGELHVADLKENAFAWFSTTEQPTVLHWWRGAQHNSVQLKTLEASE